MVKEKMVIEKILKQLTPERIEKEIEEIKKVRLPQKLQKWVREYERVGDRNPLVWLLTYKIIKMIDFPLALKKHQRSLQNSKFLMMMFVILLDDVVDKIQNKKLINKLLEIPFKKNNVGLDYFSEKEKKYFEFSVKVWSSIFQSAKKYPLYKKFEDIFQFDILQIVNSMRFAFLVNKNQYLINEIEYWAYFPCSMQVMIYRTLDLMCSPKFNIKELRIIRRIAWESQNMMRIANWISTWEREIKEQDFTSGIFAYLIDFELITINDLKNNNLNKIIDKVKNNKVEDYFLKRWEKHYNRTDELASKIKSFNVKDFLSQLEEIMVFHLSLKNI